MEFAERSGHRQCLEHGTGERDATVEVLHGFEGTLRIAFGHDARRQFGADGSY